MFFSFLLRDAQTESENKFTLEDALRRARTSGPVFKDRLILCTPGLSLMLQRRFIIYNMSDDFSGITPSMEVFVPLVAAAGGRFDKVVLIYQRLPSYNQIGNDRPVLH